MIAALIGAVWAPGVAQDRAMPTRDVLLIHGPIHYDLLIPLDDISRPRFAALEARGVPLSHPDARWLVIGWGARKFYTETPTYRELKPGNVWRGVIGDDAVLRIDVIGPIDRQIKRRSVAMTERQYRTLVDNVWSELTLGPDGLPERVGVTGYTTTDGFFAAEGRFSILRTCNVWIGDQLRAAGLRFGRWTPLPLSVSLSYQLYQSDHR